MQDSNKELKKKKFLQPKRTTTKNPEGKKLFCFFFIKKITSAAKILAFINKTYKFPYTKRNEDEIIPFWAKQRYLPLLKRRQELTVEDRALSVVESEGVS